MLNGPGDLNELKPRRNRKRDNHTSIPTHLPWLLGDLSRQGYRQFLRSVILMLALLLLLASILALLQYGPDMAALAGGLVAVLVIGVLVYFSPISQRLRMLFRQRQVAMRRQTRNYRRHEKKVNRLAQKID